MFIGKRRPVSMPVNPATLACSRHSSRLTSSESSARSSFHQAMGAIPSFAFMGSSNSTAPLGADLFLLSARIPDRFTRRDFGHADIPIGVAGNPGVGVRIVDAQGK